MNIKKETLLLLLFLCIILLPLCVMFGYNLAKSKYSRPDLDGISSCVSADTISTTTAAIHRAPIAESEKPVGFDTVYLPLPSVAPSLAATTSNTQRHVYRGSPSVPPSVNIDTTRSDTPRIIIPITQKVYRDSDYTAYVSGYRQNLDSITVHSRVTTITLTMIHRPRLNFGITLGAGYGVLNKKPDVFIGIGATYRLTK